MRTLLGLLILTAAGPALAQFPPAYPGLMRPPGDPAVVERGRSLYDVHCRACHGADLRGGDLGGPNLLRSQIVLGDKAGETIGSVITAGRVGEGGRPMPPLPLPQSDLTAVAEFIHSIVRSAQPQGAPPAAAKPALNLLVGNAKRGARFFQKECTGCHSSTADLAGIGARLNDIEQLQNSWVSGRRLGGTVAAQPARKARVTVQLTDSGTISGTLERLDDFVVSLRTAEGVLRSFSRRGSSATVSGIEVNDPMAGHRKLWTRLTNADIHNVTAYLVTLK